MVWWLTAKSIDDANSRFFTLCPWGKSWMYLGQSTTSGRNLAEHHSPLHLFKVCIVCSITAVVSPQSASFFFGLETTADFKPSLMSCTPTSGLIDESSQVYICMYVQTYILYTSNHIYSQMTVLRNLCTPKLSIALGIINISQVNPGQCISLCLEIIILQKSTQVWVWWHTTAWATNEITKMVRCWREGMDRSIQFCSYLVLKHE